MSIDEAIAHAREVASEQKRRSGICVQNNSECDKFSACLKCAEEHEQLAEWLEELKKRRNEDYGYLADIHQNIGYRKALDDLLGGMNQITYNCQDADELFEKICDLAEQLKAGDRECTEKIKFQRE